MPPLNRKENEALYKMFDDFALTDQRNYYKVSVERFRKSAAQINSYRAIFSLVTGVASALAGLIVQAYFLNTTLANGQPTCTISPGSCNALSFVSILLIIIAIIAPVIGGAFNTLSDLYQWDRLVTVYSAALDNIEVADAHSPDEELDDRNFRTNLSVYAEGTLQVMRDESAQWGQMIRTPGQNEQFLEKEAERAQQISNDRSFMNIGGSTVGSTLDNRYGEPLPGTSSNSGSYSGNNPGGGNIPQPPIPPVWQPPSVPPTNEPPAQPPSQPPAQPPSVPPVSQPPAQSQPPTPPTSGPSVPVSQPPTDNHPGQPPKYPGMPRNVAQAVPHSTLANSTPTDNVPQPDSDNVPQSSTPAATGNVLPASTPGDTDNEPSNSPPPVAPLGEDPSAAG